MRMPCVQERVHIIRSHMSNKKISKKKNFKRTIKKQLNWGGKNEKDESPKCVTKTRCYEMEYRKGSSPGVAQYKKVVRCLSRFWKTFSLSRKGLEPG